MQFTFNHLDNAITINASNYTNLGALELRSAVAKAYEASKIKEYTGKPYANQLNKTECLELLELWFAENKGGKPQEEPKEEQAEPKAKPEKQAKKQVVKSGMNPEALQALQALMSPQIDEEAIIELVRETVRQEQGQAKRIKVDIDGIETPEVENKFPEFEELLISLQCGIGAFLAGPAGSGKTTLAKDAFKALGVENVELVSCEPFTMRGDFFGKTVDAKGTYIEGYFERAGENGAIIFDEITKLDPELAGALNSALAMDKNGNRWYTTASGERKKAPKYILATANTWGHGFSGEYVGNAQQDLSLLDRFVAKFNVDHNRELEKSLVSDKVFSKLDEIRTLKEKAEIRKNVGLRQMITVEKLTQAGMSLTKAISIITGDWTEDEKQACKL
jgi:MoxR-like ATPase